MLSLFTKLMENITGNVTNLWHVTKHIFAPNQDHPTSPPSRCHDFFSFWRLPQPGNSIATKSPYGGDWGVWLYLQPGGGQVKIAVRRLEWKAVAKTNANNEKYVDKKVTIMLRDMDVVIFITYLYFVTLFNWVDLEMVRQQLLL